MSEEKKTLSDKIVQGINLEGTSVILTQDVKGFIKDVLIIIGNPHLKDTHKEQLIKELIGKRLVE